MFSKLKMLMEHVEKTAIDKGGVSLGASPTETEVDNFYNLVRGHLGASESTPTLHKKINWGGLGWTTLNRDLGEQKKRMAAQE